MKNKIIKGKEFEDLEQIIKEQVDLDTEWAELQDDPEPNSFSKNLLGPHNRPL